jgi:hypothetical protein
MPELPAPADAKQPSKVVIVLNPEQGPGQAANVAACIAAGLAAADPCWAGHPLVDGVGLASVSSSHEPITVLAADPCRMREIMLRLAKTDMPAQGRASLFPVYAQAIHTASAYWSRHAQAVHADEPVLGLGLRGHKRWVNSLTGSLPLWR